MNSIPFSPPSPATPCADRLPARPPVGAFLAWSAVFAGTGLAIASGHPWSHGALYLVGVALGVVLTHTGFGFASAYRHLFLNRDAGLVGAQLWLLALTLVLFAPILALGQGWGLAVDPTAVPLALSVVAGTALFGIGMQLAGGCGSGSLYVLGGGDARMAVVLVFFCAGAFAASLHLGWWAGLPAAGEIVLGERLGWGWAVLLQLAVLALIGGWVSRRVRPAHTAWADWRRRYPQTLVLSPDTGHQRDYRRDPYAGYVQSEQVMFPLRFKSQRFHPKESVIGVERDGRFKAYPFAELERANTPFSDPIGDHPVRVEYDAAHRSGRVLDANGQEIPSMIGFWFAWYAFHPETEVYTASKPSR